MASHLDDLIDTVSRELAEERHVETLNKQSKLMARHASAIRRLEQRLDVLKALRDKEGVTSAGGVERHSSFFGAP